MTCYIRISKHIHHYKHCNQQNTKHVFKILNTRLYEYIIAYSKTVSYNLKYPYIHSGLYCDIKLHIIKYANRLLQVISDLIQFNDFNVTITFSSSFFKIG